MESGKSKSFGISLQAQDKYILENLRALLGSNNKLKFRERKHVILSNKKGSICKSYTLRISCNEIYNDLIFHNILPRKTYIDRFPIVSDNLFFDFLRGYIDGDGYICCSNNAIMVGLVSYNKDVLKYIQDKLLKFDISSKIYLENRENSHIYRFQCYKTKDVKKILDYLYQDENCLKLYRKYQKYKSFYNGSPI